MWSHIADVWDLNENLRNEIEHFFQVYKVLEGKPVDTEGFGDRAEALQVIAESRERAAGA
jgi:inorganic pyrophosphatase